MTKVPLRWTRAGLVEVRDAIAKCPTLPKSAGIYRLTFANGFVYIGESKNLRARLANYCKPTSGTEQEHVLQYILLDAGGAVLAIMVVDSLRDGHTRRALEREEKKAAVAAKSPLLNKGGLGQHHYLKFKLRYHLEMLEVARRELESCEVQCPV